MNLMNMEPIVESDWLGISLNSILIQIDQNSIR